MSLDLEENLKVFFASAPASIYAIQTIQISHSDMSQTYYFWREPYTGQITLENDAVVTVQPLNMEINIPGTENHLDQRLEIKLSTVDIEDEFRNEMDLIPVDTTEKIIVTYREYLSDDLTAPQIVARLQVETISYNKQAAMLSAVSPRLNVNRTGTLYTYRDFPMLRGFI